MGFSLLNINLIEDAKDLVIGTGLPAINQIKDIAIAGVITRGISVGYNALKNTLAVQDLAFDAGNGTLSPGDTITGSNSGVSAIISSFKISTGDSTNKTATGVIKVRNIQKGPSKSWFDNREDITTSSWSGVVTTNTGKSMVNSIVNMSGQPLETSIPVVNINTIDKSFLAYIIKASKPGKTVQNKNEIMDSGVAIRRPLLGSVMKENLPACLSFTDNFGFYDSIVDGNNFTPTSSTEGKEKVYKTPLNFNFLMTNLVQGYAENVQIVQTFGSNYFFFFGQKPSSLNVSGILLNTRDFAWRNDFLFNYLSNLRGTKASASKRKVKLSYDELIFTGYILTLNLQEDSQERDLAHFSFDMVITSVEIYPSVSITGKSTKDFASTKEKPTVEYFQYLGPLGQTTKDGKKESDVTINLHPTFASTFKRYIGFNPASINRINTLGNILTEGSAQDKLATGMLILKNKMDASGSNIFDLGRIIKR